MTQYVGVIRKDMGLYTTPEGGVQLQRNLDSDKNKVRDMKPEQFAEIGVTRQQKYNPQGATAQVPSAMANRVAAKRAAERGVKAQKIGQGIGGAVGVLSGLVSLANAGAAGQDALTGLGQAYQTGEYMQNYASPRIGNFTGKIGARTAKPVMVERQKTHEVAPMVASPTNTPAPTPPVAVTPRQNLSSDPRQILGVDNYAGVQAEQDKAMTMLGNPYYREGEYSAVNTTDEQGRNINLPGAGPAINQFDPMMMHQPSGTASSPMTPMGTFQVTDAQGRPVHPPALTPPAEPTVAPPTGTPSAGDVGGVIGGELGTIQQQTLPLPDPNAPTDAEETIQSSEQTGKTISDALKKAEILGRQAAYDDFVKMFVEVKS